MGGHSGVSIPYNLTGNVLVESSHINTTEDRIALLAIFDWVIDFGDSEYVVRYRFDSELVIILAVRHKKEVGY
jgi:hypothetical protein